MVIDLTNFRQTTKKTIIIKNIPEKMNFEEIKSFFEISSDSILISAHLDGNKVILVSGRDTQIFNLWLKNGLVMGLFSKKIFIGKNIIEISHHFAPKKSITSNEVIISGLPQDT
ncbi:hypothetical protein MXB_5235, partial [Myxobolus squamalis]